MPKVTLISTNGNQSSANGGCFGFTGRSGSTSGFGDLGRLINRTSGDKLSTYRFHIGEMWAGNSSPKGLNDPVPYIKWIVEGSAWSKYFKGCSFTQDNMTSASYVDIRCDIPGHCIIGAASAVRLASHRHDTLIPFWNRCVAAGGDPAIALLVFYALGQYVHKDYTVNTEGLLQVATGNMLTQNPTSSSGQLSLSDDEVMDVSEVAGGLLYSFISGDFEMIREDGVEDLYESSPEYNQDILNSFRSSSRHRNRKNLGMFLLHRFYTTLTGPDTHKFSGGMGTISGINASRVAPIALTSLIGWTLQLTFEFSKFGRFLGWRT